MITRPCYLLKCTHSSQVNLRPAHWIGNLWDFSVILNVVPSVIGSLGDHLQTCQVKSAASQVHDWVVYRLGGILGSVGHKVKIQKITPGTGKERGDLEIKDYVALQKPSGSD